MRVKFWRGPWHGRVEWVDPHRVEMGIYIAESTKFPPAIVDGGFDYQLKKHLYRPVYNQITIGGTTMRVPATDPNGTLYLVCED